MQKSLEEIAQIVALAELDGNDERAEYWFAALVGRCSAALNYSTNYVDAHQITGEGVEAARWLVNEQEVA